MTWSPALKDDALNELQRLSSPSAWQGASLVGRLTDLDVWAEYAEDALRAGDIQGAKACLAVIRRLLAR